jgi:hypothetical protein
MERRNDFDVFLDVCHKAAHTFQRFASPELVAHVNETGLGNNPEMIRLFYNIHVALTCDSFQKPEMKNGKRKSSKSGKHGQRDLAKRLGRIRKFRRSGSNRD